MAQVTGGLVSVEDGSKVADKADQYDVSRKVRVDLSFLVGDGEDYQTIFDRVSEAASNRVASLLGRKPTVVASTPAADASAELPRETGTRKPRRTKEQMAADAAAAAGGQGAAADPSSMEDPTGGEGPTPAVIQLPDASAGAAADPAALVDEETPVEEIDFDAPIPPKVTDAPSDADLNSAVQKRNAELNDPDLIRGLISSYNPEPTKPFQLRQIAADKRAEFLTKLAALTKAA